MKDKVDEVYSSENEFNYLGRLSFYNDLKKSLENYSGGQNIALSGGWGTGKTFLVKKLIDDIEDHKDIFGFYFNAWENDYFETPLYAVLSQLLNEPELEEAFNKAKVSQPKIKLNPTISFFGVGVAPTKSNILDDMLAQMKFSSYAHEAVMNVLNQYMFDKKRKLIFVVDELDRCKPNFAIHLLEQLKHIQDERIIFLYVVDYEQLCASIKSYYGSEYNSEVYLYKIFDEIISFPQLDFHNLFAYIVTLYPNLSSIELIERVFYDAICVFDISLRDLNRFSDYLPRIGQLQSFSRNKISQNIYITTLLVLCLLRIKFPVLVRESLSSNFKLNDLGLKINRIDSYSSFLDEANRLNPEHIYNLEKIVAKLLEDISVRKLLY